MEKTDWESLIAGRWLNAAGLLLVFLGTVFFLKTAFDHGWIAPVYRVALGIVSGAALIAYAQLLAGKGKTYFAEGLTALGAGIEFLSVYASNALFRLASPSEALAGMVAVTAAIAVLAWRRKSMRLAILAAVAGFAAPVLAGTQDIDPWSLCAYIVILDAGLLTLAAMLEAPAITPLALGGTLLYAVGYFPTPPSLSELQRAMIDVALYAPFAIAGWVAARRGCFTLVERIAGAIAFAGLVLGLETALYTDHRAVLAVLLIAVAALHVGAAIAFESRVHSWLATAAITLAIPAAFHGSAINVAWAVEAALLSVAGMCFGDDVLRVAGTGLLGLDIAREIDMYALYTPKHTILNGRFLSGAATITATFFIAGCAERLGCATYEANVARVLRTTAHAMIFCLLGVETWDAVLAFGGTTQAASSALSIVSAALAVVFVGWGLVRHDAFLRWEGLGLVIATAAKVLVLDLAFLDLNYRVSSAVIVGGILLGISYAYQRYVKRSEQALV
jgi:uncharacterized membrane protein